MDGTGAGDGLHGADTGLGDCRGGGAHEEGCGGSGEGGKAFDGEVFVEGRDFVDVVADLLFFFSYIASVCHLNPDTRLLGGEYLLDRRQNPRLCIVISVGTNNEVDLFIGRIALEILRQAKERIRRSSSDKR